VNFSRDFRKLTKHFFNIFFTAERQTERGTNITNKISHSRCAITNVLHIYRRPAKFLAFLQTVQSISHYCVSGRHGYTRSIGRYECLRTENPILNITLKFNHSVSHRYMVCLPFLLRHYHFITDTSNSFCGIYRTAI